MPTKSPLCFSVVKSLVSRLSLRYIDKMTEPKQIRFIISSCLIGCRCRYDGNHQLRQETVELFNTGEALAVCPEELGGLPTPRVPCEIVGNKIVSKTGEDKTHDYNLGAQLALELASTHPIEKAFLKSKSPMCGYNKIYDGTFKGTLTNGNGLFAELLNAKGITLVEID